jgi:glutathione S-transferase|tara:strand:+ start:3438 stop:3824 length:387 start_codon:yes stop_codon:yes gene_type:complete
MEYSIALILIALLQFIFFTGRAGFSRGKYDIKAPKTVGNERWERIYRIQQNTMEQLLIFIPGTVIFSLYVSATWVLLPGILFIVGRHIYSRLYLESPENRGPGMVLSFFSNIFLVIAGLVGISMKLIG